MLTLLSFAKRNIFNFSILTFRDNPVIMRFCCQTMTYVEVCLAILGLLCHKEKSECPLLPDQKPFFQLKKQCSVLPN